MDREFIRAMFATAEILGTEISKERVAGYWSVLESFGTEAIVAALRTSVQRSRFFPAPAELIAIITGEDGDVESEAMASWAALVEALHTPRAQDLVDSDLRIRAGVNAAGGLYVLRTGSDDEPPRYKKLSFCRAFAGTSRIAARRQITGQGPLQIGGAVSEALETIREGKEQE